MLFSSRECIKAGVIYIGPGQEEEAQVLGKSEGMIIYHSCR